MSNIPQIIEIRNYKKDTRDRSYFIISHNGHGTMMNEQHILIIEMRNYKKDMSMDRIVSLIIIETER